jgi:DNA-binding NarL/FixJ family response regulator
LRGVPDFEIVAEAGNPDELLEGSEQVAPDVIVVTVGSPITEAGMVNAARDLRTKHPTITVVVIAQQRDALAQALLSGGAGGVAFLVDEHLADLETLVGAIVESHRGPAVLDGAVVDVLFHPGVEERFHTFTPRELAVLAELASGSSNAAIGKALFLSKKAVERHISSIFRKLELRDDATVDRRVVAALLYTRHPPVEAG